MFVTNYCQSNIIACVVSLIPKHSFCNTICVCMVMQIKLVVINIGGVKLTTGAHEVPGNN